MRYLAALLISIFFSTAAIATQPQPGQMALLGAWCATADEVREAIATGDDGNAYLQLLKDPSNGCFDVQVATRMGIASMPIYAQILEVVGTVEQGKYIVTILKVGTDEGLRYTWHVEEAQNA